MTCLQDGSPKSQADWQAAAMQQQAMMQQVAWQQMVYQQQQQQLEQQHARGSKSPARSRHQSVGRWLVNQHCYPVSINGLQFCMRCYSLAASISLGRPQRCWQKRTHTRQQHGTNLVPESHACSMHHISAPSCQVVLQPWTLWPCTCSSCKPTRQ